MRCFLIRVTGYALSILLLALAVRVSRRYPFGIR
jgi:hypothetical protein